MGNFLDLFPKTLYKLDGGQPSSYDTITNITFRVGVLREVMANHSSYYQYTISDGETPETLADRVYGNPQAHWIILYANNIFDPQYGWPLEGRVFNQYIIDKYGTMEWALTNWHHYEKVITRENTTDNIITVNRYQVNGANVALSMPTELDGVPYDTYSSLETAPVPVDLAIGGKTVHITTENNRVSYYDWEEEINEAKRNIRVIKKEYYGRILAEFDNLTRNAKNPFLRRLS